MRVKALKKDKEVYYYEIPDAHFFAPSPLCIFASLIDLPRIIQDVAINVSLQMPEFIF